MHASKLSSFVFFLKSLISGYSCSICSYMHAHLSCTNKPTITYTQISTNHVHLEITGWLCRRRALSNPFVGPRVRGYRVNWGKLQWETPVLNPGFEKKTLLLVRLHTSSTTNRSSARSRLSSFVVKHSSISSHSRSPSLLLGCVIFLIPSSNSHSRSSLFLWW